MKVSKKSIVAKGIRFSVTDNRSEVARAFLYIIRNDLHKEKFGLLEDVFVSETHRGKGLGPDLVRKVIEEAKKEGCYKLVATSRYERGSVHEMYKRLGFEDYGKEFRVNLK